MNNTGAPIITFYSYKGGVGRSMSLANVAWVLAEKHNRKVLVVDWDLEAPGLHRFFGLDDSAIDVGLIELLNDYKALIRKETESLPEKLVHVQKYIKLVRPFGGGGAIYLLPAGRPDKNYANLINEFNWEEFYSKWHGFGFIEYLKKEIRGWQETDIVLIDSRTGVTDIGGICTLQLPDIVVLLFGLNEQNINGARSVAEKISTKAPQLEGRDSPPALIIRAARVERAGNQEEKIKWLNIAAERLGPYLGLNNEEAKEFMARKNIPYIGDYSYGETPLAVQKDPLGEMADSFEDLAASILDASRTQVAKQQPRKSHTFLTYLHVFWEWQYAATIKRIAVMAGLIALVVATGYYVNYRATKTAAQKQAALQRAFSDAQINDVKTTGPTLETQTETYQRAIATYDKLIENSPQFAEAFNWRANAYSGLGQYERALQDYNRAIELNPDYAEALSNLGAVYKLMADRGDTGNYGLAINAYNQAIKINPELATAYFGRAEAYRARGDKGDKASYDQAIADYTRIISQLKRGTAEVYFKRGLAHKAKGDGNNALADLQKTLELPGDDVLRENAKNNLQELKANPPPPQRPVPPKIFIEYNDPDDKDVVDQIAADLTQSGYKVVGTPQVSAGKTNGDVRCFNAIDLENTKAIAQIVQDSLSRQGHNRMIEARPPLGGYPNVPLGSIEVWIPSLQIGPEASPTSTSARTVRCPDATIVAYGGCRHSRVANWPLQIGLVSFSPNGTLTIRNP